MTDASLKSTATRVLCALPLDRKVRFTFMRLRSLHRI